MLTHFSECTITLVIYLAISNKCILYYPAVILFLGVWPTEMPIYSVDTQCYIRIFIAELHRTVPNFKLPKCPTAKEYVNGDIFTYCNVIQQEKI